MASNKCCYTHKCKNGTEVKYCITVNGQCPTDEPGNIYGGTVGNQLCGLLNKADALRPGSTYVIGNIAVKIESVRQGKITNQPQERTGNLCCFTWVCPNGDIRIECYRNLLGGPCVGLIGMGGGFVCLLKLGDLVVGRVVNTPNGKFTATAVSQNVIKMRRADGYELTVTNIPNRDKKYAVRDGKLIRTSTGTILDLSRF